MENRFRLIWQFFSSELITNHESEPFNGSGRRLTGSNHQLKISVQSCDPEPAILFSRILKVDAVVTSHAANLKTGFSSSFMLIAAD